MDIDNFLTYLKKTKNASLHTITAYASDLHQFEEHLAEFCQGDTSDSNITLSVIRVWIMDMADKGITNRSITRKISALRTYFFYKETVDNTTCNPMAKIVAPKIAKRKMPFISQEEITKLLSEQYD
ncbi:MAG: site-specific integrase, partial [Bacteroidota bacterium]|nr:site-specific integrase [Bacteroidota bacterium]